MTFLRVGLLLLMMLRVAQMTKRWHSGAGSPITVGTESARVQVGRGKHREISGIRLSLDVSDQFRFALRPERAWDRFAKRFGVAKEWQTGDETFDSKVFILSEDATLLETLSTDRELRSLIAELLDFHGGGRLDCARGRLTLSLTVSDVDRDQTDETLGARFAGEMLPTLARLRDRLARISSGDWQADRDPALTTKAWLVGISTALAVAGLVGLLVTMGYERHQIVREAIPRYSLWMTSGIGAALLAVMLLGLRRGPHTPAVLLDILLAAMPGVWMASDAGLTWYNEAQDTAAPSHFSVNVESTYTTRHKGNTHYHLVVSQWPDARGNREVEVREHEYSLVSADGCLGVLWHPGRLGDGWVSGYERANTRTCGVMIE